MDKIIEKLGIYDLLVNMLIGTVIFKFSLLWAQTVLLLDIPESMDSIQTALVCGYIIGTIVQELGNRVQKRFSRRTIIEKTFFKYNENIRELITEEAITKNLKKRNDIPTDESKNEYWEFLYYGVKEFLYKEKISMEESAKQYARDGKITVEEYLSNNTPYKELSSMEEDNNLVVGSIARSMMVFGSLFVIGTIYAMYKDYCSCICGMRTIIISLILTNLFRKRWLRFTEKRIDKMFDLCVSCLLNKQKID